MMDIEPLIEAGSDGGSFMGWYAKGHHDREKFHDRVDHDYDLHRDDRRQFQPKEVTHEWWRCVPMRGDPGMTMFRPAEPHARGAFAVTVMDVSKLKDKRRGK